MGGLQWTTALGIAVLAASIIVFLARSDRPIFPIVLAAAGVFFCVPSVVKLGLPGDVSVEFDQVAAAAQSNANAVGQQQQLVQQLDTEVVELSQALQVLQTAVNTRLAAAGQPPVQAVDPQQLQARRTALSATLQKARAAQAQALAISARLPRLGLAPAVQPAP